MLELIALAGVVFVGLAVVALIAFVGFLLKFVFKIVLFPISLAFGVVKLALGLVLIVLGLVVAPILFGVLLVVAIPVLILFGIFGIGAAAFA